MGSIYGNIEDDHRKSTLMMFDRASTNRTMDKSEVGQPMDSFDTEFGDDGMSSMAQKKVVLNEFVVKEWTKMLKDITENEADNICEGEQSEYIDSCPKMRKLQFIMRCYNYYLGKTCKCDHDDNAEETNYSINSMTDLINNLEVLSFFHKNITIKNECTVIKHRNFENVHRNIKNKYKNTENIYKNIANI